ncbi:MAG: methyltransferase [Pseudomonadota bacterium]
MRYPTLIAALVLIAGCSKQPIEPVATDTSVDGAVADTAPPAPEPSAEQRLQSTLDAMPAEHQQRYPARNPKETLEFFGVEPDMTVVEALPGGGWYSKILAPYLGSEGTLIGVDYSLEMYPLFGFFSAEAIEKKRTWTTDFVNDAQEWRGDDGATVEAFVFGSMDDRFAESADAVLMVRALHNLNRFENEGGFRSAALQDAFDVLKPGGILGVVQHHGAEDMPDAWADGSNGYLKQSTLVSNIEAAGFEFVESSDINANPADQPTETDMVWRLPPTLGTSKDDDELRAQMLAIGESNRMTLKFRKPE